MKQFILLGCLCCFATLALATPGVKQREILFGSHQPLTGLAAQFAVISKSTEIYFRYVNDQGGIHGRLLKYHYADDGFQPFRTKEVVRRLILQDSVFLILNGLGTATHAAVTPWLQSLKIPDFFVGSSDSQWTEPLKETIFGFHPPPRVEGRVLGKYLLQFYQGERIVVWHRDGPAMKEATEHFSALLAQEDTQVHSIPHPIIGYDVLSDLEQIKQLRPQAVVLFTAGPPAIQFLKQAYEQELQTKIYLGHDLADSRLLEWVGIEAMEEVSVLCALPLASQTDHPGIRLHRDILNEYAPDLRLNRWTIYGQAVAELMVEILHRSGRNLTRQKVITTAEQLNQWQGLLNPPVTLTPQNHQPITQLRIAQVKSGKFEIVSDWIDSK